MDTKIEYWDDGKTVKEVYTVDENGKKQGDYEYYDRGGTLVDKCIYKDDTKNGPYMHLEWHTGKGVHEDSRYELTKGTFKNGYLDGVQEEYYDREGKFLKAIHTYKNKHLDGPYAEYFSPYAIFPMSMDRSSFVKSLKQKDFLKEKGHYKDGRLDGVIECYKYHTPEYISNDTSEPISCWLDHTITYKKGQTHALYKEEYSDGSPAVECGLVMDPITGIATETLVGPYQEYFPNGQLVKKCSYQEGVLKGAYEEYYENSQLKKKCTYTGRKSDQPYVRFGQEDDAYKLVECVFHGDELRYQWSELEGDVEGTYEEYYENGQLNKKFNRKEGRLDGPYEEYYKNGQLKKKCAYKDGELDGSYEEYNKGGQLTRKCTFQKGNLEGIYERYHFYQDQLLLRRTYKNGKLDGTCEEYDYLPDYTSPGPGPEHPYTYQLRYRKTYKNGILDGPCEELDYDHYREKGIYKNGKKNGIFEQYNPWGRLIKKATYKDGKLDGPYEEYGYTASEGELIEKGTYKDGKKEGLCEKYDKKGNLIAKETYRNGKLVPEVEPEDKKERRGLNARLKGLNKIQSWSLRRAAQRNEIAKFRKKFPDKTAGK